MSDARPPSRRAAQMEETRRALVAAGHDLFAERGYAATSVDDIARAAGVTTGALYHHFRTKTELFVAVFEAVEAELNERSVLAAMTTDDPLVGLERAFEAFLDAALDPGVQRIALRDAPAVLGPDRYQEIDERYAYAGLLAAVQAARSRGDVDTDEPEALAHVLLGAVMSGGALIARSADPGVTRVAVGAALRELLAGLRRSPGG